MIKRLFLALALIAGSMGHFIAQNDSTYNPKINQYIGVQINQLIKQVLNFSGNNTNPNNPYLITYSANLNKKGWGIELGYGINYSDVVNKDIPTNNETKSNDMYYRIGLGKTIQIGRKVEVRYSLDYIGDRQVDNTLSQSVSFVNVNNQSMIDSSSSVDLNKTISWGIGPKLSLGVYVYRRILIGTEASYYYESSKVKQNIATTDRFFINNSNHQLNSTSLSTSNHETDLANITFTLPVTFFLIVRF